VEVYLTIWELTLGNVFITHAVKNTFKLDYWISYHELRVKILDNNADFKSFRKHSQKWQNNFKMVTEISQLLSYIL